MKVIDLRPDSKLLTNFDSYKLSLASVPVLKISDSVSVLRIKTDQFSISHSTLFQLQNHLISDPWLSNICYYISQDYLVEKVQYNSSNGKLIKSSSPVYKIKVNNQKSQDIYNAEFKFVSEKFVLLSDGHGGLDLIETGDRKDDLRWKRIETFQPLDGSNFILKDAKFKIEKGEKLIHCLLLHIEQINEKYHNIVDWITIKEEASSKKWVCEARRTIQGKGTPLYYLSLDAHCQGIVYSSNHTYRYTYDSVNEVIEEIPRGEDVKVDVQTTAEEVPRFEWSQKEEEITINFQSIPDKSKDDYKIKCLQNHINVTCGDEILMNSDIFDEIDVDLTTWSIQNDFLQLNLIKKDQTLCWPYLIPGGPMEKVGASSKCDSFLSNSQPVVDLNAQMEECDFGNVEDENNEYFLERLDNTSHLVTHKVFLSTNHPLFAITLRPGYPKAIAIRNDVDCCLWLQSQIQADSDWSLKHEGTLNAFGFIQASKTNRKYLACSPDLNVAVIAEPSRYIFIYKKNNNSASGLRNRHGPQLQIGEQKLVQIASSEEVLGIHVENEVIMLLTENSILCIQLLEEE